jgi:hypothetical protein
VILGDMDEPSFDRYDGLDSSPPTRPTPPEEPTPPPVEGPANGS